MITILDERMIAILERNENDNYYEDFKILAIKNLWNLQQKNLLLKRLGRSILKGPFFNQHYKAVNIT